jgi:predicted nucleic acid-binding protein
MPDPDASISVFMDSSALFAGIASSGGAARVLLLLAEEKLITVIISEQVVAETERAVARKVPQALATFRQALRSTGLRIVRDPTLEKVRANEDIIGHLPDVAVVVAAMEADVDCLVTFSRRHFVDDPGVAARSGLRIGSPGDGLTWVREQLARLEG